MQPGAVEARTVLRIAIVLAAAILLELAPVTLLGHANLLAAPAWVRAAVFLAVVQLAYAAWMIVAPDWAAVRVQMIVSAAVAAIYGLVMAMTMATPVNSPLLLGLGEVRRAAPAWCGLILIAMGAATWLCGRTSTRWRKLS